MVRVLKTVFEVPSLVGTIERKQVLKKIDQHKDKRLILLKAGPGFGKSVVAANYYQQVESKIWISIPRDYFSFSDFLQHLIYALDQQLDCQKTRELMNYSHLMDIEQLIVQTINILKEATQEDFYLFIDDLHHLLFFESDRDKIVELFFSFLPENVHVVATSHTDLPFPLTRFGQVNDLFQIGKEMFSFSIHETKELLIQNQIETTVEDLYQIDQLTNGWIFIIVLLLNEIHAQGDNWSTVIKKTQLTATSYIDLFISRLEADLKKFLVDISIFDDFDPDLCNQFLKRTDSLEMLDLLASFNFLYLTENRAYRMHQLIKDHLLTKIDPRTLSEKYAHLADIALEQGNKKSAIFSLMKGKRVKDAVKLILEFNEDRVRDIILMQHWFEMIPEEYFTANPLLYFYRGQVKERITQLDDALEDYQLAEKYCSTDLDRETHHIISAHIIGIYWHQRKFSLVIQLCQELLPKVAETELKTLALLHNLLGTALLEQQQKQTGMPHLEQALHYCQLKGDDVQAAWITNNLCYFAYIPTGAINKAVASYREVLHIFEREQAIRGKTLICMNLSNLYLRMGQTDQALLLLEEAERINIRIRNFNGMPPLRLLQARAAILKMNLTQAEQLLKQNPSPETFFDFMMTQTYLTYSYLHTAKGDLKQALAWVEQALEVPTLRNNYLYLDFSLQKIWIKYLQQEYETALELVALIKDQISECGYHFFLTVITFFEAVLQKLLERDYQVTLENFVGLTEEHELYFLLEKYPALTSQVQKELPSLFTDQQIGNNLLARLDLGDDQEVAVKEEPLPEWPDDILQISMLGEFTLRIGTRVLRSEDWTNKKAFNLLKYLILNRGEFLIQDQILEIFWPTLEWSKARQSMYVALNYIRKQLEPQKTSKESKYIISQHGMVKFNSDYPYMLDLEDFLSCHKQGTELYQKQHFNKAERYLLRARYLYAKGLLPENLYQDWCETYRTVYQQMYIESMQNLMDLTLEKDLSQALVFGQEILSIDPYSDQANLSVLKILIELGDSKGAIEHYQQLKDQYQQELGIAIPPSIRKLKEELNRE